MSGFKSLCEDGRISKNFYWKHVMLMKRGEAAAEAPSRSSPTTPESRERLEPRPRVLVGSA